MKKQISLPCGINENGNLVYIDNAKNGLDCNCFCPACKQPLVAKNAGTKREHHFAHFSVVECEHAYQTALHYMAKDLFLEMQYLTFIKNNVPVQYKIDNVELECKVNEIIPDILVTCDGKRFIVEIFVTHAVDDIKKQKIRDLKFSAIEIDLSRFRNEKMIDKDLLRQELSNTKNYSWIYDADIDLIAEKKELIEQFGLRIPIQIENSVACPIIAIQKDVFARFVPLGFCFHCYNCVWDKKSNYIRCGLYLPLILSLNERKKNTSNVLVNDNRVLFKSEFQIYNQSFRQRLTEAVQYQYSVLKRINNSLPLLPIVYNSIGYRQNNRSFSARNNSHKRRNNYQRKGRYVKR